MTVTGGAPPTHPAWVSQNKALDFARICRVVVSRARIRTVQALGDKGMRTSGWAEETGGTCDGRRMDPGRTECRG